MEPVKPLAPPEQRGIFASRRILGSGHTGGLETSRRWYLKSDETDPLPPQRRHGPVGTLMTSPKQSHPNTPRRRHTRGTWPYATKRKLSHFVPA